MKSIREKTLKKPAGKKMMLWALAIMIAACMCPVFGPAPADAGTGVSSADELKAAITAAPAGTPAVITLAKDIDCGAVASGTDVFAVDVGKNIVLDLNGHTISAADGTKGTFYVIDNYGTLDIRDSAGTGGISVTNSKKWSTWTATGAVRNRGGNLTIDGGAFSSTSTLGSDHNMCYALDNYCDIYFGAKDGKGDHNAVCTINGGSFTSDFNVLRNYSTADACNVSLTVNNGTFTSNNGSGMIYLQNNWNYAAGMGTNGAVKTAVNGGTFNSKVDNAMLFFADTYYNGGTPSTAAVNGGTFNENIPKLIDYYGNWEDLPDEGSLAVNGGTFKAAGYTEGYSKTPFTDFTFTNKTSREIGFTAYTQYSDEENCRRVIELLRSNPVITFNTNGGSAIDPVKTDGTADLSKYVPVKAGYDFEGWYTDELCTHRADFTTLTENTTLYAKWTRSLLLARVNPVKADKLRINWTKVTGADKYIIYGNKCNTKRHKYKAVKIKVVPASTNTLLISGLKKHTGYKYKVMAYRDGRKIATSFYIHNFTARKHGRSDSIKTIAGVKKTLSLKVGGKYTAKARIITYYGRPPIDQKHASKIRLLTTDTSVARVKGGKVIAVGAGTCSVYTALVNGSWACTKVTVR